MSVDHLATVRLSHVLATLRKVYIALGLSCKYGTSVGAPLAVHGGAHDGRSHLRVTVSVTSSVHVVPDLFRIFYEVGYRARLSTAALLSKSGVLIELSESILEGRACSELTRKAETALRAFPSAVDQVN